MGFYNTGHVKVVSDLMTDAPTSLFLILGTNDPLQGLAFPHIHTYICDNTMKMYE